jgi:hypothetical protein
MTKQLTLQEIYSKVKEDYDIESLLEPYKEGGTERQPVERSSGTLLNWLINKKKFPPDVAGAGLISVLMDLKRGKSFPGDGSYGSKGDQLAQAIAHRCDEFGKERLRLEMFKTIAGAKIEIMEEAMFEMCRSQLPFFIRWVSPGTWRWLRKRRLKKRVKKNEPS